MRKTLWCFLLLLLWAVPPAARAEGGPLTAAELYAWREDVYQAMLAAGAADEAGKAHDPEADTWLFSFPFGVADLTGPALYPEENLIAGVEVLTDALPCPRGVRVGDPYQAVLAAYANDNPSLAGDAAYAALYVRADGELDEGSGFGWLLRRGQAVSCVQYAVALPARGLDGFRLDLNLRYIITEGRVSSIRADGFRELITDAESLANLTAILDIAAKGDFTPADAQEAALGPLTAADLTVWGLPVFTASEDLISRLGKPDLDEYNETDGVRTLVYEGALVECILQDGVWRVGAVLVNGGTLPGPRGVCVGDTLPSVLARFGGDASGLTLAGDGDRSLTYRCEQDGVAFAFTCMFHGDTLVEYLLHRP